MAGLLFIVSRTKPGTYIYVKRVSESEDVVILDRRKADRRQVSQETRPDRRNGDRRRRDVTRELRTPGWALVNR